MLKGFASSLVSVAQIPVDCARPEWLEADRLAALRGFAVLDSDTGDVFEDFVRIAADICNAPIAVVSLVDATRQWFAAETGLGVSETPRDVSICAHAIQQGDVFVVPDLSLDVRFVDNPLVTGPPYLRFYGGAVLETSDGLPLGTICVLDHRPRPEGLTERQAFTLRALSRQVMTQLELRRSLAAHQAAEAEKDVLLAEKDLLIQEIDHRVKNSLAMVQGLLMIQGRAAATPDAARQLKESAGRVHTIAAMHDLLYRAATASHIATDDYLERLLDQQRAGLVSTQVSRTIVLDAAHAIWPAALVPTLGLITVELVTNALKYGEGDVSVVFRQGDGRASLTVEDAGAALPDGFDPATCRGLGLRLIASFLQTRSGTLTAGRVGGRTRFVASMAAPA
jgi:two-component sensor histidine kinase